MPAECTFCQIVAGELPADYVYEDDFVQPARGMSQIGG